MDGIRAQLGFFELPTLFWIGASDVALQATALAGLGLPLAVLLGIDHAAALFALWTLYLSVCHVGQTFWGYGWEILLLETGFLAVFLGTVTSVRALRSRAPPSAILIWLLRWLLFRVMLGAGLIKLRGDACWTELTCLDHHYETHPVPSPVSWLPHQAPQAFHRIGVVFNHVVEPVAPLLVFGPRRARLIGGGLIAVFQLLLIVSGNLSFLNWLTLAICIARFDDAAFERAAPARVRVRAAALEHEKRSSKAQLLACGALAAVVTVLSVGPNFLKREGWLDADDR
jgi:hypothetical protein